MGFMTMMYFVWFSCGAQVNAREGKIGQDRGNNGNRVDFLLNSVHWCNVQIYMITRQFSSLASWDLHAIWLTKINPMSMMGQMLPVTKELQRPYIRGYVLL